MSADAQQDLACRWCREIRSRGAGGLLLCPRCDFPPGEPRTQPGGQSAADAAAAATAGRCNKALPHEGRVHRCILLEHTTGHHTAFDVNGRTLTWRA